MQAIKAREPKMELLVSKWNHEVVLNVLVNIVPENQICKIIRLKDSVETVLLKNKMSNI